jgi:hypothetical protein
MNSPAQSWKALDKLILVAGHAVYIGKDSAGADRDENWVLRTFQRGEPPRYIEHVRFAVQLAASLPNSLLIFSGGQTRLEAGPQSEGQSYWLLADQFSWWQRPTVRDRATTEEFARDSFENLLFGIARFRECTGHYPRSIEVVGWKFKRERFDLHRETIKWSEDAQHYKYQGVNNPDDLDGSLKGEAKTLAAFRQDPFGTEETLRRKREGRNPFNQRPPYPATCREIADLLSHTTRDGMTFEGTLPWNVQSVQDRRLT